MRGWTGFARCWRKSAAARRSIAMHEMTVTQNLLNMALEHAQGWRVAAIHLRVGRLSPIVPGSVQVYFDFLSRDTLAEGAELRFEMQPIEITCQNCGRPVDTPDLPGESAQAAMVGAFSAGCACGSRNLRVTGGVSFEMVSIEVAE